MALRDRKHVGLRPVDVPHPAAPAAVMVDHNDEDEELENQATPAASSLAPTPEPVGPATQPEPLEVVKEADEDTGKEPYRMLSARVPLSLMRKVRLFAVTNEESVQSVVQRAVVKLLADEGSSK